MSDFLDVIYRLRDMAGKEADKLQASINEAQAIADKLNAFAHDAEDVAELAAASDLFPEAHALVPERSGLTRI
ncbi:hypothetical protein ABC337_04840 [Arthrobacter sp. 1P04PC]|uniref:hypothetical protein n=1 Tax=unclassified Arthrobacter TaxID=235627 RepID=UPI0039A3A0D1